MNTRTSLLTAAAILAAGALWAQPKSAPAPATESAPAPKSFRRSLWTRFFPRCLDRSLLQDGFRAVTVPIDGLQLRNLRTGDRIDLLATFAARVAGNDQKVTATILQNVPVVGIDMPAKGQAKGGLTLLLNPTEGQYAMLSSEQSDLAVALRRDGDDEMYPMEMATFVKLFR